LACFCISIPTPLEFGQMLHWVCLCLLLLLTRQISTSTWLLFVSTTLFIKNHSIPFYGILEINKQVTAHNFLFLLTKNIPLHRIQSLYQPNSTLLQQLSSGFHPKLGIFSQFQVLPNLTQVELCNCEFIKFMALCA
jgi:uncharacterized protein (UPF0248 family)